MKYSKHFKPAKKIQIIDVRSTEEYEQAHIPNALHIALQDLEEQIPSLDKDFQFVTVCGKGWRTFSRRSKTTKRIRV